MKKERPENAPSVAELKQEEYEKQGLVDVPAPGGAYDVYCREKGLDPHDTQSMVLFEQDWPEWGKP